MGRIGAGEILIGIIFIGGPAMVLFLAGFAAGYFAGKVAGYKSGLRDATAGRALPPA